jgi:ubiquinone/menaquinone biosynthesis C-methylase UbiE
MTNFKQTWWDEHLPTKFNEFSSWIGDETAESKVFCRNWVKEKQYKSLVDIGCGNASEFEAYKKEYPELEYLGVDSSKFLYDKNTERNVPMLLSEGATLNLEDSSYDVAFSRHVLEHQPDFRPILSEMIRVGKEVAIHVFFIKPNNQGTSISYNEKDNLYHNYYGKKDIEDFLKANEKVESFEWISINGMEEVLIIHLK